MTNLKYLRGIQMEIQGKLKHLDQSESFTLLDCQAKLLLLDHYERNDISAVTMMRMIKEYIKNTYPQKLIDIAKMIIHYYRFIDDLSEKERQAFIHILDREQKLSNDLEQVLFEGWEKIESKHE